MGLKEDEFFVADVEEKLNNCKEYDDLEYIFGSYEKRINSLKAADKKYLEQHLCDRKALFMKTC